MAVLTEEVRDDILVLLMNNPPVNWLGLELRRALWGAFSRIAHRPKQIRGVVLGGFGGLFSAGANIHELSDGMIQIEPILPQIVEMLETSETPCVAAIRGEAIGGGVELALGCHERVAQTGARLGLTGLRLGVTPGAGATQRLPRLIGVEAATDMILSGKMYQAEKALALGLIDEIAEDALARAVERARELASGIRSIRRSCDLAVPVMLQQNFFKETRDQLRRQNRHFHAPFAALDCIEASRHSPFKDAVAFERARFVQLLDSEQARALRHVFFAEGEAARIPGLSDDLPSRAIARIGLVGCGTMGRDLAIIFAKAGISVTIIEKTQEALDRGLAAIDRKLAHTHEKEIPSLRDRISSGLSLDLLDDADLVLETVFEDMALKREIFTELGKVCKEGAILATSTLTFDIDVLAACSGRESNVIGLHFYIPALANHMFEVVRGDKTSPEVLATCLRLARRLGKIPILVRVGDGFVGVRLMLSYLRAAEKLLFEGASLQQIDGALEEFGFAMGPFRMQDLIGLDVLWRIHQHRRSMGKVSAVWLDLVDRLYAMGRYGQKNGAGWYRYDGRVPSPDPSVDALIEEEAFRCGERRRDIDDQEIIERCIYPVIGEGARVLEEGVALRAGDIDVIWNTGFGFPRWRGGLMYHGDQIRLGVLCEALQNQADRLGIEDLLPVPLLLRLAREGSRLATFGVRAKSTIG